MKKKQIIVSLLKALAIVLVVLYFACPVSCRISAEGISLSEVDYTTPKLEDYGVKSSTSIEMTFSRNVILENLLLSPDIDVSNVEYSFDEDKKKAVLSLSCEMQIGKDYSLIGTAIDDNGNSLSFSVPVTGFNSKVPTLELTEIHPMYGTGTSKGEKYYKCEFVEILVKSDGNTAGIAVYGAKDGIDKGFTLPAMEVKEGDLLLLHFRTKGEGCINETSDDISLATGKYSSENARDLYLSTDAARLGDEEDCIVIENKTDGKMIDFAAYSKTSNESWSNEKVYEKVKAAVEEGIWPTYEVSDAIRFESLTASKSLYKEKDSDALKNDASLWKVSASSGESPGKLSF